MRMIGDYYPTIGYVSTGNTANRSMDFSHIIFSPDFQFSKVLTILSEQEVKRSVCTSQFSVYCSPFTVLALRNKERKWSKGLDSLGSG